MARFRKIDVRMWSDSRFRDLSPIPPCGQGLWIYLLTSPYTTNIPGLYRASEGALADDLRWPLKAFRKAFLEASQKDMVQADWTAPLVFVKNALRYNRPESPNVITSWRSTWDEIPECSLKISAYQHLKAFAEDLPKAFLEAFTKALPEGSLGVSTRAQGDPSANQEQEQEQEQEIQPRARDQRASRSILLSEFEQFWEAWPGEKNGKGKAEEKFITARRRGVGLDLLLSAVQRWEESREAKASRGEFVPPYCNPATWLHQRRWEDDLGLVTSDSAEELAFRQRLRGQGGPNG